MENNLGISTRVKKRFIRPIPFRWMCKAMQSKATATVGLAIWFQTGVTKENCFGLETSICKTFRINHQLKRNGLKTLEELGLIQVQRNGTQNPIIEIIEETEKRHIRSIPLSWMTKAIALESKAPIAVALAIWYRVGRTREETVVLSSMLCNAFGINRQAKRKGLAQLEAAELIRIERSVNKNPIITLLEANEKL